MVLLGRAETVKREKQARAEQEPQENGALGRKPRIEGLSPTGKAGEPADREQGSSMMRVTIACLGVVLSGFAFAHDIVHQETEGDWTSYQVRCSSGKIRYIAENTAGFWVRGKSYGGREQAIAAACEE